MLTYNLLQTKEAEQEAAKLEAVFPCILKIMPTCIFNKKDPIVLGVEIEEGIAKVCLCAYRCQAFALAFHRPCQSKCGRGASTQSVCLMLLSLKNRLKQSSWGWKR